MNPNSQKITAFFLSKGKTSTYSLIILHSASNYNFQFEEIDFNHITLSTRRPHLRTAM